MKKSMFVFGKKEKVILGFSVVLAVLFTYANYKPGLLFNIANFLFVVGMVHVMIGCCVYVRNMGLFKTFSYMAYKRKLRRLPKHDHSARPISLADYTDELWRNQKPLAGYYVVGVPFLIASIILGFVI